MNRPELPAAGLSACLRFFLESLFDEVDDANANPGPQTRNAPVPFVPMRSLATGRALHSIPSVTPALVENL